MDLRGYQELAHHTAVYPKDKALEYIALGLAGEAGELANKVKKILRGDWKSIETEGDVHIDAMIDELLNELGDILWYTAEMATHLNCNLDLVAFRNIQKLQERQARGTIKGSGDKR